MVTHSASKRSAKAAPQMEATILIEGTEAKIIKCKARQAFKVGNSSIKEGETFFLVKSERRTGRYYVTHFNESRGTYQCSCGANTCEHEHLKTTREYVMSHVVVPAKTETSEPIIPMSTPATVKKIKAARKAKAESASEFDGSRAITPEEYKILMERDRATQKALRSAYQVKLAEARKQDQDVIEDLAG